MRDKWSSRELETKIKDSVRNFDKCLRVSADISYVQIYRMKICEMSKKIFLMNLHLSSIANYSNHIK